VGFFFADFAEPTDEALSGLPGGVSAPDLSSSLCQ
jgi:hypothetical protein